MLNAMTELCSEPIQDIINGGKEKKISHLALDCINILALFYTKLASERFIILGVFLALAW